MSILIGISYPRRKALHSRKVVKSGTMNCSVMKTSYGVSRLRVVWDFWKTTDIKTNFFIFSYCVGFFLTTLFLLIALYSFFLCNISIMNPENNLNTSSRFQIEITKSKAFLKDNLRKAKRRLSTIEHHDKD